MDKHCGVSSDACVCFASVAAVAPGSRILKCGRCHAKLSRAVGMETCQLPRRHVVQSLFRY
jgi:hypothetical protein